MSNALRDLKALHSICAGHGRLLMDIMDRMRRAGHQRIRYIIDAETNEEYLFDLDTRTGYMIQKEIGGDNLVNFHGVPGHFTSTQTGMLWVADKNDALLTDYERKVEKTMTRIQ